MSKSAFDKAQREADKERKGEPRRDILHKGNSVEVIDEDSPHHGRTGAIVRDIRGEDDGRGPDAQYRRFDPFDQHEVTLLGDERGNEHVVFNDDQLKRIDQKKMGWR